MSYVENSKNGWIVIYRSLLGRTAWVKPRKTLAWIDMIAQASHQFYKAKDGVTLNRGEVIASYSYLAKRWRVSKSTAFAWIQDWVAEQQLERLVERCTERKAERFFIVNYEQYQASPERTAERQSKLTTEPVVEPIQQSNNEKLINNNDETQTLAASIPKNDYEKLLKITSKVLKIEKRFSSNGFHQYQERRKTFSKQELEFAFLNLENEASRWKIEHNGARPMEWWLRSDEFIDEMRYIHLMKGSGNASSFVSV